MYSQDVKTVLLYLTALSVKYTMTRVLLGPYAWVPQACWGWILVLTSAAGLAESPPWTPPSLNPLFIA
jgi:hypothetical protein